MACFAVVGRVSETGSGSKTRQEFRRNDYAESLGDFRYAS